jgi:hypothetical protein
MYWSPETFEPSKPGPGQLLLRTKANGVNFYAAPGPLKSGFGEIADLKMGEAERADDDIAPVILKALGRTSSVVLGNNYTTKEAVSLIGDGLFLFKREHFFPVVLHIHHQPVFLGCFL